MKKLKLLTGLLTIMLLSCIMLGWTPLFDGIPFRTITAEATNTDQKLFKDVRFIEKRNGSRLTAEVAEGAHVVVGDGQKVIGEFDNRNGNSNRVMDISITYAVPTGGKIYIYDDANSTITRTDKDTDDSVNFANLAWLLSRGAGPYINFAQEGYFTNETSRIFLDTVKTSEELLTNNNSSQKELDEATKKLDQAINGLVEKEVSKQPQGDYISYGRYVTVNSTSYNTWGNFYWEEKLSSEDISGKTYLAKGKYEYKNGQTYLSLYDDKGVWQGYINERGTKVADGKQGAYISYNKYVTVTSMNYNTWSNFNWKTNKAGSQVTNKTYLAKGKYKHFNGSTYLSIFDEKNNWQGYINENGTKLADGKQGAYISDGRKVKVVNKTYNTWSNFDWKYRQSTKGMYNKIYTVRGRYEHSNGSTFYSLFDSKGNWQGYINAKAVK